MEEFLTEHGLIIASGILSIFAITFILIVMIAVSNIDAYVVESIIGS